MKKVNFAIVAAVFIGVGYALWKTKTIKDAEKKSEEKADSSKAEPDEVQLGFLGFSNFGSGIGGSHRVAVQKRATSSSSRKRR